MALADYRRDMEGCSRCSSCKWVPYNQIKSYRFAHNCPSISKYNFHSYAGSGRMIAGLSLISGRTELTEAAAEIIFKCQLCGACDVACKVYRDDIDLTEVLLELREHCIEKGELILEHMMMIDALKQEDNTMGEPKSKRADWSEGLGIKDVNSENAKVLFHVGCRYSYDEDLRDTIRDMAKMLLSAGVDFGISGTEESCCGGRVYELGYRGEAKNFADDMLSRLKASGADTLVTPCADGYAAFKYLYPRMGVDLPAKIYHIAEYAKQLISEGRIRLKSQLPMTVTYHDPCHLGRMSEPFLGDWTGDKLSRPMISKRSGKKGVFDVPREIIKAIPGIRLSEMERIREYSWCCGAGGGVYEAFPDFAEWTAAERIEEAASTGAEALVTSCPWCIKVFKDAISESGYDIGLYEITELLLQSMSSGA